jgi:hypothetical protein
MRKFTLLILATAFSTLLFAQTSIPNGNFENWDNHIYDNLMYYGTTNQGLWLDYENPTPSVSKTTDAQSGTYAIKLETKVFGKDTVCAFFLNGNPENMAGGIPYNQHPDSLFGYFKGNIPVGDSALVLVTFKKAGIQLTFDVYKIPPGNYPTYTKFKMKINIPGTLIPDTVAIGGVSSNALAFDGIPGSTVYFDDFVFDSVTAQPALMNGAFELWEKDTTITIHDWKTNYLTNRTTDAVSGNYAVKIVSEISGSNLNMDELRNFDYIDTGGVTGGFPVINKTDTLAGYYKFSRTGTDSAWATIRLEHNDTVSFVYNKYLLPASSYTYFEIPFTMMKTPDTIMIGFRNADWNADVSNSGNILYIDSLFFKSDMVTAIPDHSLNLFEKIIAYPNPAEDQLNLIFAVKNETTLEIIDVSGNLIYSKSYNGLRSQTEKINMKNFSPGLYMIRVNNKDGVKTSKIIKN